MSAKKDEAPTLAGDEASVKTTPISKKKELSMSNSTEVCATRAITVPFHGASLFVIENDAQPYTPMRPIVQAIGLDWKSQHRKVAANQARWGMVNLTMPSTMVNSTIIEPELHGQDDHAGQRRSMTCIPVRKVAAWLTTIEPGKVKDLEVRARVIQYQDECDDALWKYWNEGAAFNPRAFSVNTSITPAQAQHLTELVDMVVASGRQKTHGETWARFHRKMGVNKYDLLPAARFDEAVQYLRGKMDDTSMAVLIQKHFPGSALMVAAPAPDADHTASAFMAAQSVAAQVQKAVFNAILAGGDDWKRQRWLVSFITDSKEAIPAWVDRLGADTLVVSPDDVAGLIMRNKDSPFDNEQVLKIAQLSALRMMGEVVRINMESDIERLKKQIRELHITDLLEVGTQAWIELSMRPSGPEANPAIAA